MVCFNAQLYQFNDHIVIFITCLCTRLLVPITNGIGQGDPLSMILFIIYNSDLVETAANTNELTLAFVDDTAFIAIGKDFNETHAILVDMLK